ncbi:flagellar assembly peptidoglycan hydrolase FlgJ [Stenotrophobium rhamnosiphilum]|uniref:Peptidoglycan hydrolase FlgJ n=1 Tax=Stenotrophobium rhamnosiphilum TaxID=2029166 RepID=A0A2T5MDE6_9GAMM|nr:flagellar assembly peptidoglycan hydrolase FlgJ [Stenotrophobium rhamnosiphilum]PTU30601.1 flagellar assembly peptidoglycan hydrolase FlgJ [Stenotrophobium rhamnosiphilum]
MALNASNVNDISQFTKLRASARAQDPEALKTAAKQFEAMFIKQLLKSANEAKIGNDMMGGEQGEFYQDMFNNQLAQTMSQGRGLGIADLLVRQLQQSKMAPQNAAVPAALKMPAAPAASETKPAEHSSSLLSKPMDFIRSLLPQAEAAARELGISAKTLVAQAALETGWGKHQIKNADGTPSYNYFGIKAHGKWDGASVNTKTHEYSGGVAHAEVAAFRSYSSPAEAFKDYVNFIKSNPRYADALQHGGDGHRYAEGLQRAGYATDPAYAQKIGRISSGPLMTAALDTHPKTLTA